MALTDTVTNRLVHPQSRQEAIRNILAYSQSVEELLKRRKVYREIIFKYLAAQGIPVPPSSEKRLLIDRVKQYWSGQPTTHASESGNSKPYAEVTSDRTRGSILKLYQETFQLDTMKNSFTARAVKRWNRPPREAVTSLSLESHGQTQKSRQDYIHRLGQEFCQWFFDLLNSQHPLGVKAEEGWGPQHFWEDARMKLRYNTLEKNMEEYVGAEMVSLRLLSLVTEEYILFNPNLRANGLKCAMSPHGLVLVAVAGTVHRDKTCLGIFEQIFGLISCPVRENTWKIKNLNLKIVGQNALEPGMQIENPSIKFESKQLQELYDGKELALF
ncbi:uncharacterized protein C3orf38 homolog isoform X1 [Pelecanus crispus]|uniref:uncharacterized protein C3orf38 homolog isoform X1 n=1 Tax=Pelecanus crispus TaxID=36300 RepID=UPI003F5D453A